MAPESVSLTAVWHDLCEVWEGVGLLGKTVHFLEPMTSECTMYTADFHQGHQRRNCSSYQAWSPKGVLCL